MPRRVHRPGQDRAGQRRAAWSRAGQDRTGQGGAETAQDRLHANLGNGNVTIRGKKNSTCLCWLPISFYSTSAQRAPYHRRTCPLCHLQESCGRPFHRTSVRLLPLAPNSAAHTMGQGPVTAQSVMMKLQLKATLHIITRVVHGMGYCC